MNRRNFLAGTALAVAPNLRGAGSLPIGLEQSAKPMDSLATLPARTDRAFRILQLTDLHFFAGRAENGSRLDEQTSADLAQLVERFEPDLLAVTGDLWHDNPDGRGEEFRDHAVGQITRLGRPWLFTWGNHDQLNGYGAGHQRFAESPGCLYRGGSTGGNYRVRLLDAAQKPLWELVCLNTTNQGMQAAQEDWLRGLSAERKSPPPTLCFFHIPLLDFDRGWKRGLAKGIRNEPVSHDSEDGSGFPALRRLGNVRACFCGHDHVNDYGAMLEGVELVFGRSTGHAGYGGDKVKKGAKLISLLPTGDYRWESVFADGSRWRPT